MEDKGFSLVFGECLEDLSECLCESLSVDSLFGWCVVGKEGGVLCGMSRSDIQGGEEVAIVSLSGFVETVVGSDSVQEARKTGFGFIRRGCAKEFDEDVLCEFFGDGRLINKSLDEAL